MPKRNESAGIKINVCAREANIAAVLWAEAGEGGTYEFVRRLVFSVLIRKRTTLLSSHSFRQRHYVVRFFIAH
jgi:hypothetical protein